MKLGDLVMKKMGLIARVLLGLLFFVFGLNYFLHFIPMPPPSGPSAKLMEAMMAMEYILPTAKVIEVVAGFLLLLGMFVPLALLLLAPIVVNIAIIHFVYDPSGAPMAAFVILLMIFNAWNFRERFISVLQK